MPIDSATFVWSLRRLFDPRTAAPSASLLYVIRNAREVNTGALPPERLGVEARRPVFDLRKDVRRSLVRVARDRA